ncbi:glycosyltransferase family 4 protein [Natrinema hispanicum]|uniref:Glycosyltransferase involved in cell wall bisynthesis n=1 Tax=Natrinema hispanicum TaxID=392421 RepID=A0A1I0JWK5_9EURY|nr:glycosyltransferase family 4 protein [Natrinema hispanicum]SEU14615.1 Glycosyltransferase involved in cell wall bisynthesis [Natrinema hispanicum]
MEQVGVLYYVGSFPKLSESFILNEINELYNQGYNIAVFARNNPGEDITHEEYENIDIPIYYTDDSYTDFPKLLSKKPVQMAMTNAANGFFKQLSAKEIGHNLLLGKQCAEFVESLDFDIDIIHAHFASSIKIGSMLAARYHGIPCTVTAHAVEIFKSPNIRKIKYICDSMDHVIVPSEYNQRYLREEIGIENNITVVPATTRIKKFEPSEPTVENRLLTVGRLVEKKGHTYGIEAVNNLVEMGYNITYNIIGTGDRKNLLQRQVEEHGIEDHVEFLGHVSDERLQRELSEASVFVLPCVIAEDGDRDAMPVVLKEAMASETACVSTTVSAIPELITDGHNGLLVPEKEPEKLATAVQEFLDHPKKREHIAENGRETVHNKFDISESVDTLTEVFESLYTD